VDQDGHFEVRVGALKPGWYELRLRFYLVNGAYSELKYRFTLGGSLEIPADKLGRQTLYELHVKPAIAARDAEALCAGVSKLADFNDVHYRRARAYHGLLTREETKPRALTEFDDSVRQVPLSAVKWQSASVGWERPACDRIPSGQPLETAEQFHDTGIYAHADSSYVYELGGKWTQFSSAYGLQNLCEGSVVFVVKCDGREVFRSRLMDDWAEGLVKVDLAGVDRLELIVEDGGDGKWGDCGVWFSPMLMR
jgi:hypothetical protein